MSGVVHYDLLGHGRTIIADVWQQLDRVNESLSKVACFGNQKRCSTMTIQGHTTLLNNSKKKFVRLKRSSTSAILIRFYANIFSFFFRLQQHFISGTTFRNKLKTVFQMFLGGNPKYCIHSLKMQIIAFCFINM